MYHHERRERRRRRLARRSLCSSRAAGFHIRATFSTTTTRHAFDASFVPRAQVATMAEAEAVPVPPAAPPADEPETCIPPPPRPGCDCGARRSSPRAIDRTTDRSDRSVDRAPSSRTLNRRAKRYPSADPSRDLTPPTPKKSNSRLRPPRIRRPDEPVRPAVELQAVQARQGGRGRRAAPADERGDERFRKIARRAGGVEQAADVVRGSGSARARNFFTD